MKNSLLFDFLNKPAFFFRCFTGPGSDCKTGYLITLEEKIGV